MTDTQAAHTDIRGELERILRAMMPDAPEDVNDDMLLGDDLGMDSLRLLELAAVIEQRFGLPPLDMEQAITVSTVGDVVRLVEDLCARVKT
jgi:acyl carrier protein